MGSIELVTEIPGPRSKGLAERAPGSVGRPVVPGSPIFMHKGSGALLTDVDGNTFIDLIGGVGCLVVGHSHPKVVQAIVEQTGRFTHTDFSLGPYESYLELAERLSVLCGGNRKAAFFNSGAEAVENAVKIAKGATGRPGIVCFENAFHGRTLMAMTLTSREDPYKKGFGPFAPEVYRATFPELDSQVEGSIRDVATLIDEHAIAGVIVEPVQGEGGFVKPGEGFLTALSDLCRSQEVVLIADEVQSGYGRTGSFLASDLSGVRPDLIVLGKSIAAGLPLSAVVGDSALLDALGPNTLGGTYVGNPVACAAALAVLDVMQEEDLISRARTVGNRLWSGWQELAASHETVRSPRGIGAMVAVELVSGEVVARVIAAAQSMGVLSMSAGKQGNVIRHLMPLVITDDQLDEAFGVFAKALDSVSAG